ncbi:MAG: radical SAM protein [Candidatus Omnitrophota bacterium]
MKNPSLVIRRLDLKVGYACSNDCLFCVVADKRSWGEKTTAQIKSELKASFLEGKREAVLTGGEVSIRPDAVEIVEYARSLGYEEIQVQTNGRRFADKEFCKKMIRAGMTTFVPAIHGPNAAVHDGLTRSAGSWRQTVLGIHNVCGLGVKTLTNTVVTKQNYRTLPEMARLLVKLGVVQFQFAFIHIQGNAMAYHKKIVPRISRAAPFIIKGLEIGIRAGRGVMAEAVPLCLLEGYEACASEFFIPAAQCKEIRSVVDNFDIVRKYQAKAKFPSCRPCRWFHKCEGPWIEYPMLFGTKEFQPVKLEGHNEK